MNIIAGLHQYSDQKLRQIRLQRKRDGQANHDHTFDNMSRKEIDDFLGRLQEIQENRKQIKCIPDGHAGKKLSSHYGRLNSADTKKTAYRQKTITPMARAPAYRHDWKAPQTPRREEDLYRAEWMGRLAGKIEYQKDAETEDEPLIEPDNAPMGNTHGEEKTDLCQDCCRRTGRCICEDIFPGAEYEWIRRKHNDSRPI